MAGVADDLAFLRDHRMAALGAGVKEGGHFIDSGWIFHYLSELKEGRQGSDDRQVH